MKFCRKEEILVDNRVRTGHGKPGKSWNLSISVSRPGKSWNFIVGHGKVMENYSVCGT